VILGLIAAGCAEQAQRPADNTETASARLKTCATAVYNSPEAEPIRPHTVIDLKDATPQQLNDPSKATSGEIAAIYNVHPAIQACRRSFITAIEQTTPTYVPILAEQYEKSERGLAELVQRRISWGSYLRLVRAQAAKAQTKLTAAAHEIDAGLPQSREAQLARQKAATDAVARWTDAEEKLNALSRGSGSKGVAGSKGVVVYQLPIGSSKPPPAENLNLSTDR
jgi:hypothetical protein